MYKEQQSSQTEIFRGYGVAEAPSDFQAGWFGCMYLFSFFVRFIC
jgi:hypothetical protein